MADKPTPDASRPPPKRDGRSANGRKYGSKNKRTLIEDVLINRESDLANLLMHWVGQGNSSAISTAYRYLLPPTRARPLNFNLPQIKSAAELPGAINHILTAMKNGELSLAEAQAAINVYDTLAKAYSIADFERRIQALEKGSPAEEDDDVV